MQLILCESQIQNLNMRITIFCIEKIQLIKTSNPQYQQHNKYLPLFSSYGIRKLTSFYAVFLKSRSRSFPGNCANPSTLKSQWAG